MRALKATAVLLLVVAAVFALAYGWKQSPMSSWLNEGHDRREITGGDGDAAPPPPDGERRGKRGEHGGSFLDVADSLVPIALVTAAVAGYDRVTRRRRRARRIRLTP